jgi:hypothetical protein
VNDEVDIIIETLDDITYFTCTVGADGLTHLVKYKNGSIHPVMMTPNSVIPLVTCECDEVWQAYNLAKWVTTTEDSMCSKCLDLLKNNPDRYDYYYHQPDDMWVKKGTQL